MFFGLDYYLVVYFIFFLINFELYRYLMIFFIFIYVVIKLIVGDIC